MRWLALVVSVGACNSVYGLDDHYTESPTIDSDGDGVSNADDNCPTVANPDQADADLDEIGDACDPCPLGPESGIDADGDGVDDACDPCPRGAQHDEDGDGVFDACDNCPATPNPTQANEDNDDLGDACDVLGNGMQKRIVFDGFGTITDAWQRGILWMSEQDAAEPRWDLALPGNMYSMVYMPQQVTQPAGWAVTMSITTTYGKGLAEIRLTESSTSYYPCGIINSGSGWQLWGGGAYVAIPDPGPASVVRVAPASSNQLTCELVGSPYVVTFPISPPATIQYPLTIMLFSQIEHGGFNYIDVVE